MKTARSTCSLLASVAIAAAGCGHDEDLEESKLAQETGPVPSEPCEDGELGSLIPWHKDGIHLSLVWDAGRDPWLCFWMRPSEYRGTDLVDPVPDPVGMLRDEFQEAVYGGRGFSTTLDHSVLTRIKADIPRDNALCLDLTHPHALWESGKYNVAELTPADFAVNAGALRNAGHTLGLHYNLFCAGHAALHDGRILVAGGHDKSGNYGLKKVNIFDPKQWQWASRPVPPVKAAFLADPTLSNPASHPDANDEQYTDPPDPRDMAYQRWYPTVVPLPDGRVLVLSGTDQDSSLEEDVASANKVRQGVPEVYDPHLERTIALENAYKLLAMYPRSAVVQTGKGRHDWKVAVMGDVAVIPDELDDYDPFTYSGKTHFFDLRGALADPLRHIRAEKHWYHVATATIAHDSGADAQLWELDKHGRAKKQRWALFGGSGGAGIDEVATVEMIDFSDHKPKWKVQQPLAQPVRQNNAVVLPDGKVFLVGGRGGDPTTNNLKLQIFDPDTGTVRTVATTTVPRHDHSTAVLLPNGMVIMAGGNRVQLVPGDANAGVPVGQLYKPPYLFRGPRPKIAKVPEVIEYDSRFNIKLEDKVDIEKVTLVRAGPVTHNWAWGNRWVSLGFEQHNKVLKVTAPKVPGLAVPGYYMLFVLDEKGVPSKAATVKLRL